MSGTFSRTSSLKNMVQAFGVPNLEDWPKPSYNIKPTSYVPTIISRQPGEKEWRMFHWWLIYPFSEIIFKDRADGSKSFAFPRGTKFKTHFNTKKETLLSKKPYWTKLLKNQRALIPASGFVEWPDDDIRDKTKDKIPHYIRFKNDEPFFFAAIWDYRVDDEGKIFNSCNLITGGSNELLEKLPYERSPIMFRDFKTAEHWIDPREKNPANLAELLTETPAEELYAIPISPAINKGDNNSEELLEPLDEKEKSKFNYDWF